ncbi:hypothetical protein [Maridesulfovibrio ferrireducens]|uniref:hypothetical protein n=1 Tax=Maridesulfovibrio ferrireducens TaxID=246191 RepID=UPI001A1CE548|nr:hypothetical protein [Maridesulfovibrio ferrireducens]MBI9109611.1 hypothetical protein [Maridesulfovibrio ferrireducens]
MTDQKTNNPEESWKEMIEEFGNDHSPLGPKLSKAFTEDSYSLMWHVSWFKFAGKMIGDKGKTLVFDPLEGLGAWTVACETKDVIAALPIIDSYEKIRAAWPAENILFEKNTERLLSADKLFAGVVCFDIGEHKSRTEWESFFKDGSRIVVDGGIVIAGGRGDELAQVLKKAASANFKHVFMFGQGQPHPCISPADAVIVLAC